MSPHWWWPVGAGTSAPAAGRPTPQPRPAGSHSAGGFACKESRSAGFMEPVCVYGCAGDGTAVPCALGGPSRVLRIITWEGLCSTSTFLQMSVCSCFLGCHGRQGVSSPRRCPTPHCHALGATSWNDPEGSRAPESIWAVAMDGVAGARPRPWQMRMRTGSWPVGGTVRGTGPRAGWPGRRPGLFPDGGLEFLVLRLRLWVLWVKSDGTVGQVLGLEPWLVQGPTAHCPPDGISATSPTPGSRILLGGGGARPQSPLFCAGRAGLP